MRVIIQDAFGDEITRFDTKGIGRLEGFDNCTLVESTKNGKGDVVYAIIKVEEIGEA